MPRHLDNPSTRELIQRIEALHENAIPIWGKMTPIQMLAHCTAALKMAFGELPVKVRFSPWKARLAKLLFVEWFAIPKDSPTSPELDPNKKLKPMGSFLEEKEDLIHHLSRMNNTPADFSFGMHPIFRAMDRKDWGKLVFKHLDHHLRQFGV